MTNWRVWLLAWLISGVLWLWLFLGLPLFTWTGCEHDPDYPLDHLGDCIYAHTAAKMHPEFDITSKEWDSHNFNEIPTAVLIAYLTIGGLIYIWGLISLASTFVYPVIFTFLVFPQTQRWTLAQAKNPWRLLEKFWKG